MDLALADLLTHYRALSTQMREDADALDAGRWRLFDGPGYGREISKDWAAKKRAQADQLDKIVAAYEARNA